MISFSGYVSTALAIIASIIWVSCQQSKQKEVAVKPVSEIVDAHSFNKTGQNFLKHLTLDLKVDFTQKTLAGFAEWELRSPSPDTLILDTRDLQIKQISVDGQPNNLFSFGPDDPILGTSLSIPLPPNAHKVRIEYATLPKAAALQWLDPVQTLGKKHPFLFTQSQAILARSWIPCYDSPGARFTYSANIHTPPDLMALMSAENDTTLHADGLYHFEMKQPVPSYLMALAVGNFSFSGLGSQCGVYAEPEMLAKAASEFKDLDGMIRTASSLYGNYQWGRYDILVLPPSFPFGGMENPRLTFATPTIITGDRSLVSLIAHELAHSWSGNLVTNTTWNDFWLNEGFTVYFEYRIMEALYGKEFAKMHEVLGMGELQRTLKQMDPTDKASALKQDLKGLDPDDAVNDIAYEKGRFFLRAIEEACGREKFDQFLKRYFAEFAFKTITTETFVNYLQKNLIANDTVLERKINAHAWIYEPGLPANCPVVQSDAFDQAALLAKDFSSGKKITPGVTSNWHTFQWLHFLRTLPENLSVQQMTQLDNLFHFTSSTNSEILCDWFQHVIPSKYAPGYASMEHFLISVGRRKFIQPLYSLMAKDNEMKKMALAIYAKAKPGYHSVSSHTIDHILNPQ